MRKSWKVLPLAAVATLAMQFATVGAPQAQTGLVGGTTGGLTAGTTGGTTAGTTTSGTTGGVAPKPVVAQPRFTG